MDLSYVVNTKDSPVPVVVTTGNTPIVAPCLSKSSTVNAPLTLTIPGVYRKNLYTALVEVTIIGASTSNIVGVEILDGTISRWKEFIKSGSPDGTKLSILVPMPIKINLGSDMIIKVDAGGTGVITVLNVVYYEQDGAQVARNYVINGDFSDGITSFTTYGFSSVVSNNVCKLTTTTNPSNYPRIYQTTPIDVASNVVLFVRCKATVINKAVLGMGLSITGTVSGALSGPGASKPVVTGQEYTIYGNIAVSNTTGIGVTGDLVGFVQLRFSLSFLDETGQLDPVGVEVDIKELTLVNLTDAYGIGNEPSAEYFNTKYPDWWDGILYE